MDGDDYHIDAVEQDHDRVNENDCRDLDDQDDSERMFGQVRLKICIFASSKTDCVHLLAPTSRIPFKQIASGSFQIYFIIRDQMVEKSNVLNECASI